MKYYLYIILICLPLCLLACIDEQQTEGANISVGDQLPQFSVVMNNGDKVSTETLQGKTALIVFFNTGCPDCRQELPVVEQFSRLKLTEVVCISRAEDAASVEEFWKAENLTMPYSAQPDRQVYELFANSRIPRLYAVDAEGVVFAVWDDSNMPSVDELTKSF